jgi:hypothetical protein
MFNVFRKVDTPKKLYRFPVLVSVFIVIRVSEQDRRPNLFILVRLEEQRAQP